MKFDVNMTTYSHRIFFDGYLQLKDDMLTSISNEQLLLFQSLESAYYNCDVQNVIYGLRHIYVKQTRKYSISNILTSKMLEISLENHHRE